MSNVPLTSTFPGSTTQARGRHLAFYETATMQVDDPTDGTAIIQRVIDLTQNTTTGGITEIGKGTPDDSSRDAGMDTNTDNGLNKNGTSLVGTNSQAGICHATSTTTTKGPDAKGDTIPIDVDTLKPGSPESPIYINALKHLPPPSPQRSNSPDIPIGPITHAQLRLSVPKGNETPFCCHADGTPSNLMKSEVVTESPAPSLRQTSHLDSYEMMDLTLSHSPSQTSMESPNTPTTFT